ncbi:MAG: iron ABC transporter permease [Candidatus Omnitrophica bacterium]|nr:iron ABC transporter permease [Candidatus Omnitrophota bacterium]MCM8827928.1 iron ABC transporter permease [Candidatus Omnitrophota bacterium]
MKKKASLLIITLTGVAILTGVCSGIETYSPLKLIRIFSKPYDYQFESTILFQIRIPRVWCAFLVGSGLSLSGLILQAILKNPLAESYILGISGGASIGIAAGIILGQMASIPVFAFAGSILSILVLLLAASIRKLSAGTLILIGIMLNFIFSSFSLLVITLLQKERFMEAVIWFMGNLSSYQSDVLKIAPLFLLPAYAVTWLFWKQLNIFSMGEEKSVALGLDPEKKKYIWFVITGLITGYCVSLAGLVGFVGLVIPHAVRILVGADHKKTIPSTILVGGSFLILADTLARTIVQPIEIPVGVISGFFGGIIFVFLLLKTARKQKW